MSTIAPTTQVETESEVIPLVPHRAALGGISVLKTLPFVAAQLVCFAAFFLPFRWSYVVLCIAMYYARMFFVTAGYHRYFSHRSFKTSRVFQFLLAFLAMTSAQKGVLWWAAHHRHHHRFSDQVEDLHSPSRDGFWWSHVGWILSEKNEQTNAKAILDFYKYPELRWLNAYYLVPPISLAMVIWLVGGWSALVWGFFISTVFLWHGSFIVNSLSHVFGQRRYETSDTSRNSFLIALFTLGEGWHNNHHHYMASARQGFFWWELDGTYYLLRIASWFGLVWDLRSPPPSIVCPTRVA